MKYRLPAFLLLSLLVIGWLHSAGAGSGESGDLTLARIFNSKDFRSERFGPARWLQFQTGYTTLEPSGDKKDGRDIVKYHPATGKREILVPAERLVPAGQEKPLKISDYHWSPDGKQLLIFTNTARVWRTNTRGDYWVLNLESWKLEQLGGEAKPSTLMFAKFSPDSSRVAYVRENNIYVEDLANHKIKQLTKDGSRTIINGTFDWVYEEEFHMRDGFRWSPDGKSIAYWQLDAGGVGEFYLINNTDSLYSKVIPVQYPKAGTTNSSARVGVVSASGGETLWFELKGDPRQHYIPRMDWAANSHEIVFQRMNRLQNTLWLTIGDIKTGKTRVILEEKNTTWIDINDDFRWLDKGKRFTWVSERDGWRRLYLVSRSGKEMIPVTHGEFDIISVQEVDDKKGWLYYNASPENATQRYLYRTRLNGKGKPKRLTPINQPGTHSYQVSGDARWAFHWYSTFERPTSMELVRLPNHRVARSLMENKKLRDNIDKLNRAPVEFFRVGIKDEDTGEPALLDGYCMKPPDFDAAKKYPVLFYVYGEPWNQTVLDRWGRSRYLWHLMLTQHGYIVMSIDNRGTPGPRGTAWRKCIYGSVGVLASKDQAAALKSLLRERPYMDAERIGIWGWSGGGSMTLNMMFRYPGLYKMGMSVAPVPDQRYYDTIYQERYMGLPDQNKEGYKQGSPITFAENLEGNLLIVHGTGDDNVHYQGTEALINKLIEHNKYFTMMAYPNRSHSIYEGKNTYRHVHGLLTRYLKENL